MSSQQYGFSYEVFRNAAELDPADQDLLKAAQAATELAYAPYSLYKVGAAARLSNGSIICGANQENASFPAGLCAERVLLAVASSTYSAEKLIAMAIVTEAQVLNEQPVAPCGICRQSIQEYSDNKNAAIKLILLGKEGQVFVIEDARQLLPFAFSGADLR
ncbi:MAG TPA: cytidine deaminase [Flavitalea sp.]|nr:cytidine deaminase [Flavitalea sp.]